MKKNINLKKDNAAIVGQSLKSGTDFVSLRLAGVKEDKIAPTVNPNRKALARSGGISVKDVEIDYLENCVNFVVAKPNIEVLSNSAATAMKVTITQDGHHLNPLQQAKDAGRRVVEYRHMANVMESLYYTSTDSSFKNTTYDYHGEKIYAYSGVLSFRNTDMGSLANERLDLNDYGSKLWKKLKDAHKRNGLSNRLASADGTGYAAPVGMLLSNEMTINDDKLKAMDGNGIFHPHIHFILFTDKELSDTVKDDIYNIWDGLTGSTYKTDIQAFSFAPVYSKSAKVSDSIVDSLKEVTKYLMDPSKWDVLALNDTDTADLRAFKIELFAEYFNAYKGRKRLRGLGLLRDAQGYISRFKKFENASIYKQSDMLPALLTQLNEIVYNHRRGKYEFNHVRVLSDDELLHENKTFLSKILVSESYKKEMDTFVDDALGDLKTDKDRLFAMTFRNTKYHSSLSDVFDMFDKTMKDLEYDTYKMDKEVFNRQQFREQFGVDFEFGNYDHFEKYRSWKSVDFEGVAGAVDLLGRVCDVTLLKGALNNLVNVSGTSAKYSRNEIDSRIFAKRSGYRDALGLQSHVGYSISSPNSFGMNKMFFQMNGMTLPTDGRDFEVMEFFVDEIDVTEWADLFRVRKQEGTSLITIGGEAA